MSLCKFEKESEYQDGLTMEKFLKKMKTNNKSRNSGT
jgi:hypothetical protein